MELKAKDEAVQALRDNGVDGKTLFLMAESCPEVITRSVAMVSLFMILPNAFGDSPLSVYT